MGVTQPFPTPSTPFSNTTLYIFLSHNQSLTHRLGPSQKREPCELKVSDFAGTHYKLFCDPSSLNILTLNISILDCKKLMENTPVKVYLDGAFPGCLQEKSEAGYDIEMRIDCDNVPKGCYWGSTGEEMASELSKIRLLILGAAMEKSFTDFAASKGGDNKVTTITINNPTDNGAGKMYIVPRADRVIVVFSLDFPDNIDAALCRIFLHEFVESQRSVNNAPPCNYSRGAEPPMELAGIAGINDTPEICGFLSFTIFTSQISTPVKLRNAVLHLMTLQDYLQYHIKATKTYMHMRMRGKVVDLLKVLNRAVQTSDEVKEKKTFAGKTFTRK